MSDKAVKACADYARLSAEIKNLTRVIGGAIDKCPGISGKRKYTQTFGASELLGSNGQPYTVECTDESDPTHLKEAYTPDVDEGYYDRSRVYMEEADLREFLSACPHCLAAHEAIQQRKVARKSLGATKRWITKIGKEAQ